VAEVDINLIRALVTVLALAGFAGIVWWAYAPSRKSRFEEDARLVFDDDPSVSVARGERK
jgi:cytochrome c oxidase cbb3-type subunit 4